MIQQLRRWALIGLIALVVGSFASVTTMAQSQSAPAAPVQSITDKPADAPVPPVKKKVHKKRKTTAKRRTHKKAVKRTSKAKTMEKKEDTQPKQ